MIDNRKEQERAELHRTIWSIANDLRGSVDGWDFKQYVLGMLFYRYISENITAYINADEHATGDADFNYAALDDADAEQARDDLVKTKGFFILPSELFENVLKRAASDENLNETLEGVFKSIEASAQGTDAESNFKGLFDDIDVNSNKLGSTVARRNERLVKLMNGVADMKLGINYETSIDAFGDAYEFLMSMLVEKYHASNCEDKTILASIQKAIESSIALRSKKALIEAFVERLNMSNQTDDDWQCFVRKQKEEDLTALIADEKLKNEETRRFMDAAFRDGTLKTTGMDIDRIMPPVSRFGGGNRTGRKQGIINKLMLFFEKYLGLA